MNKSKLEGSEDPIKKPSFYKFVSEVPRALITNLEGYRFVKNVNIADAKKKGPILVVPGFLGSDISTMLLRKYLRLRGFSSYGWDLGRNLADLKDVERLDQKIDEIVETYGEAVTLIGWSLGGIYSRQLAKSNNDKVKKVITLGSPYMGPEQPNRAEMIYLFMKGRGISNQVINAWIKELPKPISKPSVSIYSKNDGIVPWQCCYEPKSSPTHQNFEVTCGHFGMGTSKEVMLILDKVL